MGAKHPVSGPDQEFINAETRRKVKPSKILKDHFAELERLDPRVPRDEQALEVVLREFQEAAEESQDAAAEAQTAAAEVHTIEQELNLKLCPKMVQVRQDMQKQLEDRYFATTAEGKDVAGKVEQIQPLEVRCRALAANLQPLLAKQRKVAAMMATAHHKQQLGANAAVQALLNPMVGLNPRKYKAYPEKAIRKAKPVGPSLQCHMECAKVKPQVEWPFNNDSEQQHAENEKPHAGPVDPAVGRLTTLGPQSRAMVKQMLGRHFL